MNPHQTIHHENPVLVPCFLCGNGLEIRTSKRNKPYLTCDWCGVQTFIRGKRGIKSFNEYKNSLQTGEIIMTGKNNLKITALINSLAELKAKLQQLKGNPTMLDLIMPQPEPELAVQVLNKAISQIETQLQEFLQ